MVHGNLNPVLFSRMTATRQEEIVGGEKQHAVSIKEHDELVRKMSGPLNKVDIDAFLDSKQNTLKTELDYRISCVDGLAEAGVKDQSPERVQGDRKCLLEDAKPLLLEFETSSRCRRALRADIGDELVVERRRTKEVNDEERVFGIEKAYAGATSHVVNPPSKLWPGQEKSNKLDQILFRRSVDEYYEAGNKGPGESVTAWCAVTGWCARAFTKAAHIVPKSLDPAMLRDIFDTAEDNVRYNPKNGLILHQNIELAFNNGSVAIIPMPRDPSDDKPTEWRLIIINPEALTRDVGLTCESPKRPIKFSDIANKQLVFRNDNRPASRYLYFKFVTALIAAYNRGDEDIVARLQLEHYPRTFWPSPGEYLRRSSLVSLARSVSGLELPPCILDDTTFEEPETVSENTNRPYERLSLAIGVHELVERMSNNTAIETNSEEEDEVDEDTED